jgi:hypothetical protein
MKPPIAIATLVAALILLTAPASARVTAHSPTGFQTAHEVVVPLDPKAAYDAFVQIGHWWSSSHSFTGEAKNISIDAQAGGCWCEKQDGVISVRHMTVVHAAPASMLVFSGGLGPLQFMGVSGAMTVSFEAKGTSTRVTLNYAVGGYDPGNFKQLPEAVDGVIGEQVARYRNYAWTGKP